MKISACVIVKNEEKNIEQWISNVRDIADEMIVVDTGSEDETVKKAKNGGAEVFYFKWINDFAAAKNYAIEQAKGDWIIFLDADEYFTKESRSKIREVIGYHHKNKKMGSIMCRLINIDTDRRNSIIDTMLQVRIFRNTPSIRYAGKIHENLRNLHGEMGMVFSKDLEIYHTGYSRSIMLKKAQRNIKILEERHKTEGDTDEMVLFLMDAYNSLGRFEEAIKYGRIAIERKLRALGMEGHTYEIVVSAMISAKYPVNEIYDVLDSAMDEFPEEPVFAMEKGYILSQHRDFIQAERYLEKGFELQKVHDKKINEGIGIADNSRHVYHLACEALGKIYVMQNKNEEAIDYFVKGIKSYKYNEQTLYAFYNIIKANDPVDIIQILNSLFDKDEDSRFICSVLYRIADRKIYSYYSDKCVSHDIEKYLQSGNYNAAAVEISHTLNKDYNMLSALIKSFGYQKIDEFKKWLPDNYKDLLPAMNISVNKDYEAIARMSKYISYESQDSEDMPLVSIMIPTYNRPEYFEETLKSALNQTYLNIEIIVNDNSTDDRTEKLIKKYLFDKRLKYYHNKNAHTKEENFVFFEKQAKGSMLQWCMDDDILMPRKLEIMVQALKDNPQITLVTSQRGYIDEKSNDISDNFKKPFNIEAEYGHYSGDDMGRFILTNIINCIGEPSAALFRRKDLKNHYWHAECKGYYTISDVVMWLELLEKGDCVVFKNPLSYYRKHPQQEGQQPEVILLSRIEWVRIINEYYKKNKYIDEIDYNNALRFICNEYDTSFYQLPYLKNASNVNEYKNMIAKLKEQCGYDS